MEYKWGHLFILIKSRVPSKLNVFFFFSFLGNEPFWLVHHQKKKKKKKKRLKFWRLLKIEDFVGRWSAWTFVQLFRMKEDNFGQSIWDKSVVLLGTSWGTHWELDGNNKKSKNSVPALPLLPPKRKNPGLLGCLLHCLIGWSEFLFLHLFVCHHFQVRLTLGTHNWAAYLFTTDKTKWRSKGDTTA
jgi:hypothetical protein